MSVMHIANRVLAAAGAALLAFGLFHLVCVASPNSSIAMSAVEPGEFKDWVPIIFASRVGFCAGAGILTFALTGRRAVAIATDRADHRPGPSMSAT